MYLTSLARRGGSEIHPPCCVGQSFVLIAANRPLSGCVTFWMFLPLVSSLGLFRNKASVTVCAPVSVQTRALCLLGKYLEVAESLVNTYLALPNLPVFLSDCFFFSFFLFLAVLGLRCRARASPGAPGRFLGRCRRRFLLAEHGLRLAGLLGS